MARAKKMTIDYFPHMVTQGKTLYILENDFGNDGFAFWFKLLELLGNSEGHFYDYNNPADWRFLVAKTRVSEESAEKILKVLAELGAIDRELYENKVIWVQKFVDNLAEVYRKRKTDLPTKPNFCNGNTISNDIPETDCTENTPIGNQPVAEMQQSKVNKSKVNKNNNNNNSGRKNISAPKMLFKLVEENFGRPLSPMEIEIVNSMEEDHPLELIEYALEKACVNNVRKLSYLQGILNNLRNDGIKTRMEAELKNADRQQDKKNPSDQTDKPPNEEDVKNAVKFMQHYQNRLKSEGKSEQEIWGELAALEYEPKVTEAALERMRASG